MKASLKDLKEFVEWHDLEGQTHPIDGGIINCLKTFFETHILYCENYGRNPIIAPYWARLQRVYAELMNAKTEAE